MARWFDWWGSRAAELEAAALRVAEIARQRLMDSGFRVQVQPCRPAVIEGYARVMAAQAVRRSLGHEAAQLSTCDLRTVQALATSRLTQRLVSRHSAAKQALPNREAA